MCPNKWVLFRFTPCRVWYPPRKYLGPTSFVLYINGLPYTLSSALLYLFADDTKCLHVSLSQSDQILLQNDIYTLTVTNGICSSMNGICSSMKLNVYIFIFASILILVFLHTYYINNNDICRKDETKDLGIIFNTSLCWNQHHRTITSRAYRCLYLLKRTFKTHAIASKKFLYISLVRAQLTYCSQLWRPHLLKDITLLERVQCHVTKKFVLNDYQSRYKSRLLTLHLLPLMYLFELYGTNRWQVQP